MNDAVQKAIASPEVRDQIEKAVRRIVLDSLGVTDRTLRYIANVAGVTVEAL